MPRSLPRLPRQVVAFLALGALAAVVAACGSGRRPTQVLTSWKAPDASPLEPRGGTVAAAAMIESEAARRTAEDALARELSARGARGVPLYTLTAARGAEREAEVRAALERAGAVGVVVLRPLAVDREQTVTAPATYVTPAYGAYWGGYYAYGWGAAWRPDVVATPARVRTDTTVSIETVVYSLRQNRLVWAGRSRTVNPRSVDALVTEVAGAVADRLRTEGVLAP